ncbi:MAG TPA: hypothetical protein VLR90_16790 [Blastocatellia bacterium]|nr:hypothetical protein [Blastocatellia bacterium]
MKINILIEQLILDGLPIEQHDGTTVQKTVELELVHLLEDSGLGSAMQSSVGLPNASVGSIDVANDSNPNRPENQITEKAGK